MAALPMFMAALPGVAADKIDFALDVKAAPGIHLPQLPRAGETQGRLAIDDARAGHQGRGKGSGDCPRQTVRKPALYQHDSSCGHEDIMPPKATR